MSNEDLAQTVADLSRRLAALEDELAIYRVLASYGPLVDSGSDVEAAALWTADGEYDAGIGQWTGREAIAGMVAGRGHQGLIHAGAAHVMGGVPHVVVDGDQAVAIAYFHLHRRSDDEFRVWRVTATRWDLVRDGTAWKVTRRVNRLLDGSDDARQLLRDGVLGAAGCGGAGDED
ncbi:MAG TPA: nuclear transport factor 2 family protein [Acidimicrobiales bacterium]